MRPPSKIAVIGSGISGLSAAWLLSQRYGVTLFEADRRAGGHSNTVEAPGLSGPVPVDTGFIVYNTASYPNLIALFEHLGVATAPTSMSFAVSLGQGRCEYSGDSIASLVGHASNAVSPAHWHMIRDILRFFREAPELVVAADETLSLGHYLTTARYSDAFIARHILPMAAAIWSTPSKDVLRFPAAAFARFFANHGLLQIKDRPQWRTVVGGSREYVRRLLEAFRGEVRLGVPAKRISRDGSGVTVTTSDGIQRFDACVIAIHADQALTLLADADPEERSLLGAFKYTQNHALLHTDKTLMPRRRRLWSSWNYLGDGAGIEEELSVTYWMNRLQPLGDSAPELFVTLNPGREIRAKHSISAFDYAHPMFDSAAMRAQRELWRLQGSRRTWFCGSYFGYGFHEDGLQSGLAAAEDLGGIRRPWSLPDESSRIHLAPAGARRWSSSREAAE
jgi:predicted NAD/FAD-binding protein